jgi:soluble lytic murein transglycosylase-like protein
MRLHAVATWLLFGLLMCQPAWADIYAYTSADGAVSLSNMPTDDRYTVLVAAVPQAVPAAPAAAVREPALASARKARYDRVVEEVSRDYGLESALVHAVIAVESSYNPKAVSKAGAVGLMQLMPGTAKRYGVADAFDPEQNLRGGANYLRDLLNLFGSDVSLALAAFNAGEHAVIKHGNRIPPYRETLRYVPRVLDHYERFRAAAAP